MQGSQYCSCVEEGVVPLVNVTEHSEEGTACLNICRYREFQDLRRAANQARYPRVPSFSETSEPSGLGHLTLTLSGQ